MNLSTNRYPFSGNIRNSNPRVQTLNTGPGYFPNRVANTNLGTNRSRSQNSNPNISTDGISNLELLESIQEFQKSIKGCVDEIPKDVADLKQQLDSLKTPSNISEIVITVALVSLYVFNK